MTDVGVGSMGLETDAKIHTEIHHCCDKRKD